MSTTLPEFLEHYGVKGMQWGVRKTRKQKRNSKTAQKNAVRQKKQLSTEKGRQKDAARTKKFMEKYQISQKEAQRRQRVAASGNRKLKKTVAKTAATYVTAKYVDDMFKQKSVDIVSNHTVTWTGHSASTRIINNLGSVSMKVVSASVKGARLLFDSDGKMTYMPPGTYMPGSNPSAEKVTRAISPVRKALNA